MKTLLVLLFTLTSTALAQEVFTINVPIPSNEGMGAPLFIDINGNGQKELCARVLDPQTDTCWLVAWDLQFRREMGRILNTDRDSPFYPTDIDGDGKKELVTINWEVWGEKPGFVIYR